MRWRTEKSVIRILGIVLACVTLIGLGTQIDRGLSVREVEALRSEYPVYSGMPVGLEMRHCSVEECKQIVDTFIYGEIVGSANLYEVEVSLHEEELEKKREENGLSNSFDFLEYSVRVISDTEGIYQEDDVITISVNSIFKDYQPEMVEGMKLIIPTKQSSDQEGLNYYIIDGMFYVTEQEYAISVCDESKARRSLSGLPVQALMKELKK